MPSKDFWSDEEVLVATDKKNFTRVDLPEFFKALQDPQTHMEMMVEDTKDLIAGLKPPQVEVFCLHGSKVDTTERLVYPPGAFPNTATVSNAPDQENDTNVGFWPFPSYDPTIIKGDGDGTVNIRSLEVNVTNTNILSDDGGGVRCSHSRHKPKHFGFYVTG